MDVPGAGPPQARHSQSSGGRTAAEPTSPPFTERGAGEKHSILYAWELGANLGHIGTFLPVARELRAHGNTVHWAVTHPHQAARLLPKAGFEWLQAPAMPEQRREGPPLSYADILLRFGYANGNDLLGLVVAWRELLRLTRAQVLLADHAPTAILAARSLDIPVMLFGSGFFTPPKLHPTPNMRPWTPVSAEHLQATDRQALASINTVLEAFGRPPLATVAQLFQVAEDSLLSFPELDHYPARGPARYWGCLPSAGAGKPVAWPAGGDKRLFAYLRAESPHHEALLAALLALGQATVIYFPNLPPALAARFAAPHMRFLEHPADMVQMSREADLAVTYASLATTTAFLLAGKPLLLLPGHLEQFLVARRVEEMGAGRMVNPEQPPGDLRAMLADLLAKPSWRDNARAFAAKYAAFDQQAVIGNLARRISELLE